MPKTNPSQEVALADYAGSTRTALHTSPPLASTLFSPSASDATRNFGQLCHQLSHPTIILTHVGPPPSLNSFTLPPATPTPQYLLVRNFISLATIMSDAPPYRLINTPGKGFGLFATRRIAVGELIIREKPIFVANSVTTIEAAVASLADAEKAIFWGLSDSFTPDHPTAVGVFKTNAIPAGPTPDSAGIYKVASRLNHSCSPNACHAWAGLTGQEVVHAITDIPAGTEIVVSYHYHMRSREQRGKELASSFNFICHCVACTGPLDPASDARRERFHDLNISRLTLSHFDPPGALRRLHERARLLVAEGLHDLGTYSVIFNDASHIAADCADYAMARRYAGLAYGYRRVAEGAETESTMDLLADYRNPPSASNTIPRRAGRLFPTICDGCGAEAQGGFKGKKATGGGCGECHCGVWCSKACKLAHAASHKPICEAIQGAKSEVVKVVAKAGRQVSREEEMLGAAQGRMRQAGCPTQ
ncbi:uncharacterized protein MKK02DRAFT_33847 [Dioszegia hungarica]|uniref:SET domain-containing protein n=1 Tax=Dioszegia hungarica TaxID=4972 RepID=A0AA38LWU7_9TREE|nr:uncharacterized protein MKK02DRAFT_33847 [Dioszegia hungarica]KAI9636721.1 hypothetical protein MKK02DRAFT_33847 [Dioszegia hungarica]